MSELEIAGLGVWNPNFSNWKEFSHGVNTGDWQAETPLQPELIPARERRRAPQSVKLAVEVMSQACEMAGMDPAGIAAVFSSAMGDMQITDYLCRMLATTPREVSPTRFHNSVHNATTGYWSISSHSHAAANAVSAYTYTAPMAFLEAAIQTLEDAVPVLLVTQEMAAPCALHSTCPSNQPFSAAILLAAKGTCSKPIATVGFRVSQKTSDWPELHGDLRNWLQGHFGARLLPALVAMASNNFTGNMNPVILEFPLTPDSTLELTLTVRIQ
jgi:hypothetical protein